MLTHLGGGLWSLSLCSLPILASFSFQRELQGNSGYIIIISSLFSY